MRPRWGDLIAGLVLLALAVVCFSRLVASPGALLVDGGRPSVDYAQRDIRMPGNDLTFIFLPHYLHVAGQFARLGRLPQWDDSGFAGRPMVGNPQGGLFYPPFWLALIVRSPATLGWLTVAHLVWAGIGTYVLMRSLGAGRVASAVAAGCFLACPYVLGHTFEGHYPHVWAVSWYPWAFWAYRGLRAGRWAGTLALPPTLAMAFLAGHPQEWYYLVFTLSLWALADAFRAFRSGRYRAAGVSLAAWAGVLGLSLGMVAVELLPDVFAQEWTLRGSRMGLGKVSHYHLQALNLFQLLGPYALGGPADYFGHDNLWESLFSIGFVPLVLAAIAVARHPDRGRVRGWGILVALAVHFAAGRHLGLFTVLFELVPGMNRFRVPARSLFLASLGAAVLAGLGVETLIRQPSAPEDWRRVARRARQGALALVATLLVLSAFAIREGIPRPSPRPLRPMTYQESRQAHRRPADDLHSASAAALRLLRDPLFWIALAGTVGILGLGARRPAARRVLAVSLGALALAELGLHGRTLLKVTPAERFLGPDPISAALAKVGRSQAGPFRIRARDPLYDDLRASSHGIEKININDSFQVQRSADLYEALYPLLYVAAPPDPDESMGQVASEFHRSVVRGILDRMNVAFLVSDHVEPEPSWPVVATGTWNGSTFAVHRNPAAMPRAYVVPRAEPTPDGPSAARARFGRLDPRRAVLLASDPLGPDSSRQPFTPGEWASTDPDRVVVKVTTQSAGLLVVADTWMPGWTATVDGRPAPILRGNHAQRVVPIRGPGRHEVAMWYRAPGLFPGFAVTLGSGLLWATAGLVVAVRARRRTGVAHPSSSPAPHLGEPTNLRLSIPSGARSPAEHTRPS